MFYKIKLEEHIRVPPKLFDVDVNPAVIKCIKKRYEGFISKDFGFVIDILDIGEIKNGVIIPGDGAAYYLTQFELITFRPDLQEVLLGKIKDITDFGAFINLGPAEGMIHVSQTMDDFVSFSKEKVLSGKESKRSLKVGDLCRARVIAVSYKDLGNPKLGLTMRQDGLGKLEWIEESDKKKSDSTKEAK